MKYQPACEKLVSDAKQSINELDVDTVKSMQESGEAFSLIDIREDREWEEEHLPQAIHIPRGFLEFRIEKTVPNVDEKIILYCGGGGRSALSAYNLQKMGYTNVVSMDGGFKGWKAAGYEIG